MYMYHFTGTSKTKTEILFDPIETYQTQSSTPIDDPTLKNRFESPKESFVRNFLNSHIEKINKSSGPTINEDYLSPLEEHEQQTMQDFQTRLKALQAEYIASPFDVLDNQPSNDLEEYYINQLQHNALPFFDHFSNQFEQYNNLPSDAIIPTMENDNSDDIEKIFSYFNPNG